jgi:hypothetical protein
MEKKLPMRFACPSPLPRHCETRVWTNPRPPDHERRKGRGWPMYLQAIDQPSTAFPYLLATVAFSVSWAKT